MHRPSFTVSRMRRASFAVTGALTTALLAAGLAAPLPATAVAGCTTPVLGQPMTCATPGTENVAVPAYATSVDVVVIGGGGGGAASRGYGGNGAKVELSLDLTGLVSGSPVTSIDVTVGLGGPAAAVPRRRPSPAARAVEARRSR